MPDLVVALTGASGSIYAVRLLQVLLVTGHTVHVTISRSAALVLDKELGLKVDLENFNPRQFAPDAQKAAENPLLAGLREQSGKIPGIDAVFGESSHAKGKIVYHHFADFTAGIASGSFLTAGMVICPCSLGTLASIAGGHSENLIHRAADVHLKERRKLILVPRETPLSTIQLDNMHRLSQAGATIMPAMPGFYHGPRSIQDLVDFMVGRICDHLGIAHGLVKRWGADAT